jgi:hypothetical protein
MAFTSKKIAELFPEHADHNDARHLPSYDQDAGYLCGCGEHLGHPVQDEPEEAADFEPDAVNTTFQRPASEAGAAAWDRAAATVQKARQGAYGTWGAPAEPIQDEPEEAEVVSDEDINAMFAQRPEAITVPGLAFPAEANWQPGIPEGSPPAEVVDAYLEDPRANADGPVADEAQTYSAGGAGDGEVDMAGVTQQQWQEAQEALDAPYVHDDPADPYDTPAAVEGREYDAAKDAEWRRVQAQSDADFVGDEPDPNDFPAGDGSGEDQNAEPDPQPGQQVMPFPDSTAPEPGSGRGIMPPEGDMDDPVASALPGPLDATEVYTPQDVEMAIVDILARLDRGELFLRGQLARLHKADHALTMRNAYAIARSNQRAADQRKAEATILCEAEIYEQTEAAMLVRALRDTMHNLRSQLMGFQTVAKSVGVSVNAPSFRP